MMFIYYCYILLGTVFAGIIFRPKVTYSFFEKQNFYLDGTLKKFFFTLKLQRTAKLSKTLAKRDESWNILS